MYTLIIRGGLIVLFFLVVSSSMIAEQQDYYSILNADGTLTSDDVDIDPISNISWGMVDRNKIKLYEIPAPNDGYIEFNIAVTNDVEVSLVDSDIVSKYYGFKFENTGKYTLIVDGVEVEFPSGLSANDDYTISNTFKVEKCGDKLLYWKGEDLLYTYCDNEIGPLFHRTEVFDASETLLNLVFEDNSPTCSSGNLISIEGELTRTSSENRSLSTLEILDQEYPSKQFLLVTLYDLNQNPIRQFRKRTDAKGFILGKEEIIKILKRKDCLMSVRLAKN